MKCEIQLALNFPWPTQALRNLKSINQILRNCNLKETRLKHFYLVFRENDNTKTKLFLTCKWHYLCPSLYFNCRNKIMKKSYLWILMFCLKFEWSHLQKRIVMVYECTEKHRCRHVLGMKEICEVVLRPSENFSSSSKTSNWIFEPSEFRAKFLVFNYRAERVRAKNFRAHKNNEQNPSEQKQFFECNFWVSSELKKILYEQTSNFWLNSSPFKNISHHLSA